MLILMVPYLMLGTYTPEDAWVPSSLPASC